MSYVACVVSGMSRLPINTPQLPAAGVPSSFIVSFSASLKNNLFSFCFVSPRPHDLTDDPKMIYAVSSLSIRQVYIHVYYMYVCMYVRKGKLTLIITQTLMLKNPELLLSI